MSGNSEQRGCESVDQVSIGNSGFIKTEMLVSADCYRTDAQPHQSLTFSI